MNAFQLASDVYVLHSLLGALEAQRLRYEEQLSKLKEQLVSSNATSPSPPIAKSRYTTYVSSYVQLITRSSSFLLVVGLKRSGNI